MSSKAINKFSKEGYGEAYEARSFKRLIGSEIENHFSMEIPTGDFKLGDQISVILKNDKYNLFRKKLIRPPSMTVFMTGK